MDRRSSCSVALTDPWASASNWRALSGREVINSWARPTVIPRLTSLTWTPSCRSRSIRRISWAAESTLSARLVVSCATRLLSTAVRDGPSMVAAIAAQALTSGLVVDHQAA